MFVGGPSRRSIFGILESNLEAGWDTWRGLRVDLGAHVDDPSTLEGHLGAKQAAKSPPIDFHAGLL